MFKTEQRVFGQKLEGWLRERLEGSFAVIKGTRVLGTVGSFDGAIRLGIRETKSREFFVGRIEPRGTVEWMSHVAMPAI